MLKVVLTGSYLEVKIKSSAVAAKKIAGRFAEDSRLCNRGANHMIY